MTGGKNPDYKKITKLSSQQTTSLTGSGFSSITKSSDNQYPGSMTTPDGPSSMGQMGFGSSLLNQSGQSYNPSGAPQPNSPPLNFSGQGNKLPVSDQAIDDAISGLLRDYKGTALGNRVFPQIKNNLIHAIVTEAESTPKRLGKKGSGLGISKDKLQLIFEEVVQDDVLKYINYYMLQVYEIHAYTLVSTEPSDLYQPFSFTIGDKTKAEVAVKVTGNWRQYVYHGDWNVNDVAGKFYQVMVRKIKLNEQDSKWGLTAKHFTLESKAKEEVGGKAQIQV